MYKNRLIPWACGLQQGVRLRLITMLSLLVLCIPSPDSSAIDFPNIALTFITNGIPLPTDVSHAGDGSDRLFLVEQDGYIRILKDGVLSTFLDINTRVLSTGDDPPGFDNELGLFGIAFPEGYATSQHFYVHYTGQGQTSVISRFYVSTTDVDVADADSEEFILRFRQPFSNHNGGQIAFGPGDGYLYIASGDGGSGDDPQNNAQNPSNLLGKILRIDVEPPNGESYLIPTNNPFVNSNGFSGEIWCYGLRNPWRIAFDPLTHDLFIADVGQTAFEEIDFQPASSTGGENYGWRVVEGFDCTGNDPCVTNEFTLPIATYGHSSNSNCSVTGGRVSRKLDWSFSYGTYFYGDHCSGYFWALKHDGTNWHSLQLTNSSVAFTTFGSDEDGNVYACDRNGGGTIYRIDEIFTDNDNDYLPDAWEVFFGLNTNSAADADTDDDGDGMDNGDEFLAGTDPANSNSVFIIADGESLTNDSFAVQWSSVSNKQYFIDRSTNLLQGFTPLASNLPATPPVNIYTDTTISADSMHYRIGVE